LAATTYPGQELTRADYLEWQYQRNPDGPPVAYCGEQDGQTVAQYLVLPRTYSFSERTVRGSLSVNTLTHPQHRGGGWFVRLAEATYADCAAEGIGFTLGFPNRNSFGGFTGRLGFRSLGTLDFLVCPLQWTGILRRFFRRNSSRKGEELQLQLSQPCIFRSPEYRIEDWEAGSLSDEFFLNFLASKQATTARSSAYLEWRYRSCPGRRYRILRITDPERKNMLGFVVLRALELSGLRCGVLVDFGCTPDDLPALEELFRFSLDRFRASGLDAAVAAAVPGSDEADLLLSAGCYRVPRRLLPQPLEVILRIHDPHLIAQVPTDLGSWFLTFGDYDVL
jgi:hypothetical protein